MHHAFQRKPGPVADRKKQLIVQGALYRAEILASRETVRESLRPESLAGTILQRCVHAAMSAFVGRLADRSGQPVLSLQVFAPLLMRGASALMKRKGLRSVLRGGAVIAVLAGIAALATLTFRSRNQAASDDASD